MNKKKILILIFSILMVLFLFFITYSFFNRGFVLKNKKDSYVIGINKQFDYEQIKSCYKFGFICFDTKSEYKSNIDSSNIGEYEVTYTFKFLNMNYKKIIKVSVIDDIVPDIILNKDVYEVCPNKKILNLDVKAIDNIDGDITSKLEYSIEDNKLYFSVSDSNNNINKKEANMVIKDNGSPKISLKGGDIYVLLGSNYSDYGYSASDDCDGDITSKVKVSSNVDINKPGTYYINYSVTDDFGNNTSVKRNVYVYSKNSTSGKVIYLTFDDGPSSYTSRLLDILRKYDIKATFFVTGNRQEYNYNIKRAYNEGHSIGLHTYTHDYSIYRSVDTYFNDLYKVQDYVYNLTGYKSYLMRFPGGSSNTVSRDYSRGIMSILVNEVGNRGFRYFDWNVSCGDGGNANTSQVINNTKAGISGKDVSLVLMHDTKGDTINGLEEVIKYALANGYRFEKLDMTSPTAHHGVSN